MSVKINLEAFRTGATSTDWVDGVGGQARAAVAAAGTTIAARNFPTLDGDVPANAQLSPAPTPSQGVPARGEENGR